MSGGIAYVLDKDHSLYRRINKDMIELEEVSEKVDREELKSILEDYVKSTGSKRGKEILDNFDEELLCFKKVIARDYQRMIRTIAKYEEEGASRERAELEAFKEVTNKAV